MAFVNRSDILRKHMRDERFFRDHALYQEMANINEGIAEILERLGKKPDELRLPE